MPDDGSRGSARCSGAATEVSTAVILQYRDGLSHQDIATQLEVSPHMVKKYLAHALITAAAAWRA